MHVQEPAEQDAPPQVRSPNDGAPSGEVTAIDETTMKEEDLQEAVGLLTQLEVCAQDTDGTNKDLQCHARRPEASQGSRLCDVMSSTGAWP